MTELEQVWRRKTDYELLAASRRLDEYSDAAQQVIRAEIERRKSPEYLEALESAPQPPAVDQPQRNSDAPPSETSSSAWLAQRVALAVGLMIGFYLFAVGIALTLLWIPYATYIYVHLINAQIALICISSGLTILWALVPRPDRFTPPGPRLDAQTCPRLFSIVDRVAEATSQQPPSDVYLLDTVNAFVAQRGGVMGFGSRRVMGIGLPLLQTVTVPELEAIIAHEFGHYSSNDVALGPWIYKTRATIVRTIASIGKKSIRAPFLWYGRRFLRLTHGVSRRQEFIADQISARVVGARIVASALTRVSVAAQLYPAYVSQEVLPVLNSGFMPPISTGFDEFLASDRCQEASRSIAAGLESARPVGLYDTHPSLGERLAALGVTMSNDDQRDSGEPAATLIDHRDQHARALLEVAAGSERVQKLKPIEWNAVGPAVYPALWRGLAKHYAPFLRRYPPESLSYGRARFVRAGSDLVRDGEANVTVDERINRAVHLFAAGVGVALLDREWHVHTRPGSPVLLVRGADTFDLFETIRGLASGKVSADAWTATCHAFGIAGQPLAAVSGAAALSAPPILPPPLAPNEVNCWRCKQTLVVTSETRGKTIKCPQCRAKQQLPL